MPVITFPPLHTGQRRVAAHPARFKVVACGRRWGKTWESTLVAFQAAAAGQRVWIVAPVFAQAMENWQLLRRIAGQLPAPLVTLRMNDLKLEFASGGSIQCKSGDNPDTLRGAGLDLAVLDEAALLAPEVWYHVIAPALAATRGRALFLSTPRGRNWFWTLYGLGQDPARDDWASFNMPTWSNPYIPADEIETLRRMLPDRTFREEIAAEFLDDSGMVFRRVDQACTAAPQAPEDGARYVFGVDWGRASDFTVIAVMDMDQKQLVALDRFNEIGWTLQRGRLAALYRQYRPLTVWAERNSIGDPNIEELERAGLHVTPFNTTAASKGPLIDELALALERGDVTLLDDPVLKAELKAYELERLPSGTYRYNAPPGQHDDTVIAVALAWHGAQRAAQTTTQIYDYNPLYAD